MINLYSSDSEKFFNVSIAQSEPQFEIHCLKNDGFWKSVMLVHSGGVWSKPKLNLYLFNLVNATEPIFNILSNVL